MLSWLGNGLAGDVDVAIEDEVEVFVDLEDFDDFVDVGHEIDRVVVDVLVDVEHLVVALEVEVAVDLVRTDVSGAQSTHRRS